MEILNWKRQFDSFPCCLKWKNPVSRLKVFHVTGENDTEKSSLGQPLGSNQTLKEEIVWVATQNVRVTQKEKTAKARLRPLGLSLLPLHTPFPVFKTSFSTGDQWLHDVTCEIWGCGVKIDSQPPSFRTQENQTLERKALLLHSNFLWIEALPSPSTKERCGSGDSGSKQTSRDLASCCWGQAWLRGNNKQLPLSYREKLLSNVESLASLTENSTVRLSSVSHRVGVTFPVKPLSHPCSCKCLLPHADPCKSLQETHWLTNLA